MEEKRKKLQIKTENLQCKHNTLSGLFKKEKNFQEVDENLKRKLVESSKSLSILKIELNLLQEKIHDFSISIPNIPSDDVPKGNSSKNNKIVKYWGKKKRI